MIKMTGKIYIVGIGPGSSEFLTKKAIDTVKNSDYTVGSTRAIELFDDVKNKIAFNVKELLDKLEEGVELAIKGNTVSILSSRRSRIFRSVEYRLENILREGI